MPSNDLVREEVIQSKTELQEASLMSSSSLISIGIMDAQNTLANLQCTKQYVTTDVQRKKVHFSKV